MQGRSRSVMAPMYGERRDAGALAVADRACDPLPLAIVDRPVLETHTPRGKAALRSAGSLTIWS